MASQRHLAGGSSIGALELRPATTSCRGGRAVLVGVPSSAMPPACRCAQIQRPCMRMRLSASRWSWFWLLRQAPPPPSTASAPPHQKPPDAPPWQVSHMRIHTIPAVGFEILNAKQRCGVNVCATQPRGICYTHFRNPARQGPFGRASSPGMPPPRK
jgi:hypothetical protein